MIQAGMIVFFPHAPHALLVMAAAPLSPPERTKVDDHDAPFRHAPLLPFTGLLTLALRRLACGAVLTLIIHRTFPRVSSL
jgi:hypothetical protein